MDAEKAFLQNEICECNLSVKQFGVHVTRLKWINWSNRALGVQCDQMAKLFFNIWQFTTLKNCPIAFNICQSWFIIFPKCFNKPSKSYKNTFLFYDKVVKIAKSGHSDFAVIFTRWWRPAVPQKWWTHNKNEMNAIKYKMYINASGGDSWGPVSVPTTKIFLNNISPIKLFSSVMC